MIYMPASIAASQALSIGCSAAVSEMPLITAVSGTDSFAAGTKLTPDKLIRAMTESDGYVLEAARLLGAPTDRIKTFVRRSHDPRIAPYRDVIEKALRGQCVHNLRFDKAFQRRGGAVDIGQLREALRRHKGSRTAAARELGVGRTLVKWYVFNTPDLLQEFGNQKGGANPEKRGKISDAEILEAVAKFGGSVIKAATALGISRGAVFQRLAKIRKAGSKPEADAKAKAETRTKAEAEAEAKTETMPKSETPPMPEPIAKTADATANETSAKDMGGLNAQWGRHRRQVVMDEILRQREKDAAAAEEAEEEARRAAEEASAKRAAAAEKMAADQDIALQDLAVTVADSGVGAGLFVSRLTAATGMSQDDLVRAFLQRGAALSTLASAAGLHLRPAALQRLRSQVMEMDGI